MPDVAAAPSAPVAPPPAAKEGAPPAKAEEGKVAEAPKKPTHKFKVNGEEREVPLEDLEKSYGSLATGQARLKEAAEMKKKIDEEKSRLVSALKKGDASSLREAGLTEDEIDGLAIQHLSKKQQKLLEEERRRTLPPEMQELEALRDEQKEWKQEKEKTQKEKDEATRAVQVKEEEARIARNVIATLEEMPESYRRDDFVAQRTLDAWAYFEEQKEAMEKDGYDVAGVTPKFIAGKVREHIKRLARAMAESAADEELDDLVSDSVAGRVLQRRQAKARETAHPGLTGEPQVRGKTDGKEEKKEAVTQAQLMRRAYFPKD